MKLSSIAFIFSLSLLPESVKSVSDQDGTYPWQGTTNGSFVMPPSGITQPSDYIDNPVYTNGQEIDVLWNTYLSPLEIYLCAPHSQYASNRFLLQSNFTPSSFVWTVDSSQLPLSPEPYTGLYFLRVQTRTSSRSDPAYFTSHFFNISSNGSTTAPSATAHSVTAPTSWSSSVSESTGRSLSGGAIAGIVVGSVAAVSLAALGTYLLIRARRKQKATAKPEVDASPVFEVDGMPLVRELPASQRSGQGSSILSVISWR